MDINILQELAFVVNRHKIKDINIISRDNGNDIKINSLYDSLLSQSRVDLDSITKELGYKRPNTAAFKRLALRLKDKLINTLFFIDVNKPSYTDYQQAYYNSFKEYASIRILQGKGAMKSAAYLAKTLISTAKKYEFTDVTLHLSVFLRDYYSIFKFDKKAYYEYDELASNCLKAMDLENYAESKYQQLSIKTHNSKLSTDALLAEEAETISTLKENIKVITSFKFRHFSYIYFFYLYDYCNKPRKALKITTEAIDFLKSKPFDHISALYLFSKDRIITLIKLHELDKAAKEIIPVLEIPDNQSVSWYYIKLLHLMILLKRNDFNKGCQLLNECYESRQFKNLPNTYVEYYSIIESYLALLSDDFEKTMGKKFRVYKFLNEVPKFSREKQNTNISILIIHFIHLIKLEKYSEAIDRIDALNQYTYRYIRKDKNYRSHCFIKALIQISKAGFHPARAQRYADKYINKMNLIPIEEANQSIDIELVDYNYLYRYIITLLEDYK